MTTLGNTNESVKEYYGKELKTTKDLKTDVCTTAASAQMPRYVKAAISQCHSEVLEKYYGCGSVAPVCLKGKRILDLGCGAGRDVFVLSKLVGEDGLVVGVDMTDDMLDIARRHVGYHMDKFFPTKRSEDPNFSNVKFYTGKIEELDQIVGLENNYFDVIVSNCVINLCTDKFAALQHAHNLLRIGGEMYFSDLYADRRSPKELLEDRVLYGEGISGSLYWNDFLRIAKTVGFRDPRVLGKSTPFTILSEEILKKVEGRKYYAITARLWKHPEMELTQEDYGYVATYNGSFNTDTGDVGAVPDCAAKDCSPFHLDADHTFECCVPTPVSGNTYLMLQSSRFSTMFDFRIQCDQAGPPESSGKPIIPSPMSALHLCPFDFSAAQARVGGHASRRGGAAVGVCSNKGATGVVWTANWPFVDNAAQNECGANAAGSGCC